MDCDRVRDLLSDYLKEELPDDDRAGVAAHLDGCARCAADAEGLAQTLALLSALPRESAPPELLGRVMKGIERQAAGTRGGWRTRLSPPRVRIPVEAAAAVFLIVLVYGIQRGMLLRSGTPDGGGGNTPATSVPTPVAPPLPDASPAAGSAEKGLAAVARGGGLSPPAPERASPRRAKSGLDDAAPPARSARAESADAGRPPEGAKDESREPAAPVGRAAPTFSAAPAFALAPAARVSSAGEAIEPKVFAAPPSRMLKPVPYGREVALEVTAAEREGLEARIVAAAERLGGGAHPRADIRAERERPPLPGVVVVHIPAESAGAFLDALKSLGTIPPDGMPAAVDLPAGPSPGIAAYTVRLRVR